MADSIEPLTVAEKIRIEELRFNAESLAGSITGPGYTGLLPSIGGSFKTSVLQLLFATRSFCSRYYIEDGTNEEVGDLNLLLTNLGEGILSGKDTCFSAPSLDDFIAKGHPQDPLEFLLQLFEQVEKDNVTSANIPSMSFEFCIEKIIKYSTDEVERETTKSHVLSLDIPMNKAVHLKNVGDVVFLNHNPNRGGFPPLVALNDCLQAFYAPEEICHLGKKGYSMRRLTSFPENLIVHTDKFIVEDGVPNKLDVWIDVPGVIDITHLGKIHEPAISAPAPAPSYTEQLQGLGLNEEEISQSMRDSSYIDDGLIRRVRRRNAVVDDPIPEEEEAGIEQPVLEKSTDADQMVLNALKSFSGETVRKALEATGVDIAKATDWLFHTTNPEVANTDTTLVPDEGRYRLVGFISHIGISKTMGRYAAHVLKKGKWVRFEDDIVRESNDPVREMAFLYLFEKMK